MAEKPKPLKFDGGDFPGARGTKRPAAMFGPLRPLPAKQFEEKKLTAPLPEKRENSMKRKFH